MNLTELGRPIAKHFAIFAVFQIFTICGFFEGPQKSQKPQVVRSQIFGPFPQDMQPFDQNMELQKHKEVSTFILVSPHCSF